MEEQKKDAAAKDGAVNRKKEIEDGKVMAILAYIIALIPYFAEKNNKFVRYHAIQGMNILLVWVAYVVIMNILNGIIFAAVFSSCFGGLGAACGAGALVMALVNGLFSLVGLGVGIISIIGIVYAAQGLEKEVPVLGKIKIIKK